MSDKQFVDGLMIKHPHEKAPDFVKFKISIRRKELGNWLRARDDEWINIDVKESKGGNLYAEVDTWKPQQQAESAPKEDFSDDLPF